MLQARKLAEIIAFSHLPVFSFAHYRTQHNFRFDWYKRVYLIVSLNKLYKRMQLARVTPRGKPLVKHNLHWQMRYAFGQI